MRDSRFEWDDDKAASNWRKHGVTFEEAKLVFDDPLALEEIDDLAGEPRSTTVGLGYRRLLVVISTEREGRTRIISARVATGAERRRYEDDGT
jgi:uncharacterized protein